MAQVTYQFRALGADAVQGAFRSIGDAAEASARKAQRAVTQQSRSAGPGGAANKAADKQLANIRKEAALWEREEKSKTRATEREANARASAETKAATKAIAHVKSIRDRYMAQQQREGEKADRAAEKSAAKRAAMEQRAQDKASKQRWGGLGGDALSLGKGIALSAGAAAVGVLGAATRDSMALQEKANRISINARGSGEAFQDPTALRKSFEATAMATPGIKAIDVADAVQKYVSLTGDNKTALASQQTWATTASASGTDIGDIAEAAASLSKQFDITGIDDMREALASLTAQGKAGAFELKDAAGQFQRLAAAGAAFGLDKGVKGSRTLGGLTQIARGGTGSAEEATTAVTGMFAAFNSKQKQLKKAGINVFGKDGKRRDIQDLLVETIAKVGGTNASKKAAGLQQIFRQEGGKAINPMLNTYNTAFQAAKGTDAERQKIAMDALRASIVKATDAPGTWADVVEDAAQAQRDASATVTQAWERVTAMAGNELAPAFTKLVSDLTQSGALDMTIQALGVFAGALGEVAQTLTDLGLIKPKEKSLADKQVDAEKAVASWDAQHDLKKAYAEAEKLQEGPERDQAFANAESLEKQRDALSAKVKDAKDAQWKGSDSMGVESVKDFSEKYRKLGDGGKFSDQRANDLEGLYRTGGRANEFAMPLENNAQRDYRREYEGKLTYQDQQAQQGNGAGNTSVNTSDAVESMKQVSQAAKEAAEALKNIKPAPSIFGPGGP